MLIAQAKAEDILFMTHDALLADYNESCVMLV
jgi:PIN domain nuclease of toxin-antitoxin system